MLNNREYFRFLKGEFEIIESMKREVSLTIVIIKRKVFLKVCLVSKYALLFRFKTQVFHDCQRASNSILLTIFIMHISQKY